MPTPNGTVIVARSPEGDEQDVTEGVGAIYDLVIQSMDFGSGFLSYEDAVPLAELGRICGYGALEEAERYLREQHHMYEREAFWKDHPEAGPAAFNRWWHEHGLSMDRKQPHEHAWSSAGKCMWAGCYETRDESLQKEG